MTKVLSVSAYKVFSSLLFFSISISFPFFSSAQQEKYNDSIEKRIKAVENNLASEIQVAGEANWSLKERMKFYKVNGVSVAVIRNYKIEWARGYGWADSAEQRPLTTSTLFQAGSISKSLNSVGVLKLVQEGKLNIYHDINEYLSSWKFPYDSLSHGKKIWIANLLSHTAGLSVHGFPGYEKGETVPTLQQVLDGIKPANTAAVRTEFEPALKYQYSGGGTTISQLIIEDITKMPYDKFMFEEVLKPMGMSNSSFSQPPSSANENRLATGYLIDRYYTNAKEVQGKYHTYPEQAAAGLWTTPTDLAKYIIETELSLQGKSNKILSKETTILRLTPYIDSSAALGVFIEKRNGEKYFNHGGQDRGFVSRYWGSFDDGNGVAVMTNTDDMAIVNEIINSVAIVYNWKGFYTPFMTIKNLQLSDALLNSYVGQYQISGASDGQFKLAPGTIFVIAREGHHLSAKSGDQQAIEIYADTENVFFPKTSDTDIKFLIDDNGVVEKLVIHQNGKLFECRKIK